MFLHMYVFPLSLLAGQSTQASLVCLCCVQSVRTAVFVAVASPLSSLLCATHPNVCPSCHIHMYLSLIPFLPLFPPQFKP